ncbi:MAG: T9SS type A sorting domain-containing protein [Candidatus Krumholzibacteria bacterium]|nr:T9SS type A sorting domain-containing protein [Candidatus Krumholzibacteria bacterium]
MFTPNESNRIGTTDETALFDGSWVKAYNYFYKLVAVDRHGNSSEAALLRPQDVKVGALLQSYAASYSLGAIEVEWRLSEVAAGMSFVMMRAEGSAGAFAEIPDAAIEREALSFTFKDTRLEPKTEYRYRVDVSDDAGRKTLFETEAISTPTMPLTLYQNHPNPFNPSTTIRYYLSERCGVVLDVFDSSGRRIARLVNESQPAGSHETVWTGLDDQRRVVGTGVYFYRLTAGKQTTSRKMVLIR